MQEGHLRSKTLESIVQTRDVTAKIETRNLEIKKYIMIHLGKWDWVYIYHFFIGFVLYEIKITKTNSMNDVLTSPKLG